MSKQSIYVKHKDEIFEKLLDVYRWSVGYDKALKNTQRGYIKALEWVLGLDKTQEEKEKEFSDKIDALTNKGVNNDSSNK
jgi:hypothetical protein